MAETKKCPDCNREMEIGFIPDFAHMAIVQMMWHPGEPEPTKVLGMKTGSVNYDRSKFLKVTVYRCNGCGLLKSYANEE